MSIFTYNLPGFRDINKNVAASVISVNPTATALVVNCVEGVGNQTCDVSDVTLTFGSWAQITPPPTASTGVFDISVTLTTDDNVSAGDKTPKTFSMHCDIASTTIATRCTTINAGVDAENNGKPTATFSNLDPSVYAGVPVTITVTAGLEKFASATSTLNAYQTSTMMSAAHTSGGTFTTTGTNAAMSNTINAMSSTASATASDTMKSTTTSTSTSTIISTATLIPVMPSTAYSNMTLSTASTMAASSTAMSAPTTASPALAIFTGGASSSVVAGSIRIAGVFGLVASLLLIC
ncbi:hypothetical protein ANO11243_051020 [Dothideomycetidae sp. 11243]|nr:hypothetical protein ANO11243_051020 [fungal sp. No.11243]